MRGLVGEVTYGGGDVGSGTLVGDGRGEGSAFAVEVDAVEGGMAAAAAAFLSFTADAASKAACRKASGTAVTASFDASIVADTGAWEGGTLIGEDVEEGVGTADEDDGAVAFAGVVVIDVAVADTGPIASLSSPNSFHSSTCSRS
jgi:hypothetical protein